MFGTTANGGTGCLGGCGAVYSVRAPQTFCHTGVCPWVEGVAWGFHGYPSDGIQPWYENLVFDSLREYLRNHVRWQARQLRNRFRTNTQRQWLG